VSWTTAERIKGPYRDEQRHVGSELSM